MKVVQKYTLVYDCS